VTFEDRFVVRAPIEAVWRFLRDGERVGRCIPGVERVEVVDDRSYRVAATASVSFLTLAFALTVRLTEAEEPARLVSVAEGADARLRERVRLTSELRLAPEGPAETAVAYRIDLTVYGKLASLGLGVIRGKARQMAADFAAAVQRQLEAAA